MLVSCDPNRDPMTLIYELDLNVVKMYLQTKKWTTCRLLPVSHVR